MVHTTSKYATSNENGTPKLFEAEGTSSSRAVTATNPMRTKRTRIL